MPDKIDQLYEDLQARGFAKGKSRNDFRSYMLAPGQQGYQNRKAFFDDMSDRGLTRFKNYEEFSASFLRPSNKTQPVQQKPTPTKTVSPIVQPFTPDTRPGFQRLPEEVAIEQGQQAQTSSNPENIHVQKAVERGQQAQAEKTTRAMKKVGVKSPEDAQRYENVEDFQKALAGDSEAAERSGLKANAERMQEELEYQRETGQELRSPVNLPGVAPTAVRDEDGRMLMGMTTDEQRVAQYQQEERERLRKEIINSAVDRIQKDMEGKAAKAGLKEMEQAAYATGEGGETLRMLAMKKWNEADSPEKLLELLNKAYGYEDSEEAAARDEQLRKEGKSVVLAHWDDKKKAESFGARFLEENRDAIEEAAGRLGMSVEDYVYDDLVPHLATNIAERFQQNMSEKYSVKNTAEYLANAIGSSMMGTLAGMSTSTKKTRQFMQQEQQKARTGEGAHYNANFGTQALGEILMFAADAPALAVGGGIGSMTAKGVGAALKAAGATSLGAMVASGSPFLAANVGRAARYGGYAIKGGLGLAPFMGTSSAVQDLSVGDGTLASVGKAFGEGYWEGFKFGGALGAFGYASGTLGSKVGSVPGKMAFTGGSLLVENQIIASMDYLKDPDNFDWRESSTDAIYMMLASKLSSAEHVAQTAAKFASMFKPEKPNQPIRLNDSDKKYIQRAFGGQDFTEIASDVNNIGKILNDKVNIPWVTRQKVSGYTTNSFESSRPRTEDIHINGTERTISERGADGELIEVHNYKDVDELMQIRQQIEERRTNDDMWSYYGILRGVRGLQPSAEEIAAVRDAFLAEHPDANPKDFEEGGKSYQFIVDEAMDRNSVARQVITQFGAKHDMSYDEVMEVMVKKPIERTDEELDLIYALKDRLHDMAFPKGKKHTAQSRIDGANDAGNDGVVNPDKAVELGKEIAEAENAYTSYLAQHENVREAVNAAGRDARPDDIYMKISENYSGSEYDEFLPILADYANAQAKREGYIDKIGKNIEETVNEEINAKSFHGKIDDIPDTENIITIEHDGKRYTLLNGKVGTVDGSRVDPEKSGQMVLVLDENGQFVSLRVDGTMTISEVMPKADYANNLRDNLGTADTKALVETGVVPPQEASPQPSTEGREPQTEGTEPQTQEGAVGVEAGGTKITGADEASTTTPYIGEASIDDVSWGSSKRNQKGTLKATQKDGVITFSIEGHPQEIVIDGKDWLPSEEVIEDGQDRTIGMTNEELKENGIDSNSAFIAKRLFKSERDGKWYADGIFMTGESRMDGVVGAIVELNPDFNLNETLKSFKEKRNKKYEDKQNINTSETENPTIPLSKNGRTKQYHLVEPDMAIDDILQQPESKFVKGNNDPNVVADRRIKSAEERLKTLDKKLKKRFEEQDFTEEEAADLIDLEQGKAPQTEMGKYVQASTEIQGEIDYYKNLKNVWQRRIAKENLERNLNNPPVSDNEPQKTVPLQPKVASQGKTIDVDSVRENSKTPEGRKALLDRKKNDYLTRWKIAKLIYGDLFNDDMSMAETIEELISLNLLKGRTLDPETFGKELGWDMRVGRDAAKVSTMFDRKKENGGNGTTFAKLVHDIWESPENHTQIAGEETLRYDTQEIRNALIDMFNGARDKWDLTERALTDRVERAEKLLREEMEREKDSEVLGEKPVYLTDEEIERINKELPFEKPTDEEIPETPLTELEKSASELMKEGSPNIEVIDTERIPIEAWKKVFEDEFDAFLSDEEVSRLARERIEEGVFYNPETGKITVFSGAITPEELRERVQTIKEFINDRDSNKGREDASGTLVEGGERGVRTEDKARTSEEGKGEGSAEPKREPERVEAVEQREEEKAAETQQPTQQDEYLKPRNEEERKAVADVEAKLQEDIAAAQEEVRKAKSALEKARTKESDKATDMFSDDNAFKEEGQLFDNSEMPTDRSQEGVNKRTKAEADALGAAQQKLERLQSEAEHNSRVRGALDELRRQTKLETEEKPSGTTDEVTRVSNSGQSVMEIDVPTMTGGTRKETVQKVTSSELKKGDLVWYSGPETETPIGQDTVFAVDNGEVFGERGSLKNAKAIYKVVPKTEDKSSGTDTPKPWEVMGMLYEPTKEGKKTLVGKEFENSSGRHVVKVTDYDEATDTVTWTDNGTERKGNPDFLRKDSWKEREVNENPIEALEESANEFKQEQDKETGITRDETPEQQAEAEGEKIFTQDKPLTAEEIDSSNLSGVQKTWAKEYLKGDTSNELYLEAYLEAYEDVRNRRQDNEGDRSDANGTQLAGTEDSGERRLGQPDERAGSMDSTGDVPREDIEQPESGGVQRVEDSKDDVPAVTGERGDSGVPESKPAVDGLPSGGEQPRGSSVSGRTGHHVREPRDNKGSRGLAGEAGRRDIKARRSELKNKRDELLSRLKELKKKREDGTLKMAVLPPLPSGVSSFIPKGKEERAVFWELATTTAEYGYTYLEEGITKFNEWKSKVIGDFVEPIKDFFGWGNNEIDRYIEQVWNSAYEINGVTRTMSEWASFLGEKKLKEVVKDDLQTKFEKQKAAESIKVKTGDIDNIRETLPYLLPEQQDDVLKAETQFFNEEHQDRKHGFGKGMMFTNGTGTGKTYTGLGIVKRFVKEGKGRVLILTPSQEKVSDWKNDGANLGLNIEDLDTAGKAAGTSATMTKGKGVVVTTYANARQNLALLEDCFDLVVYDESHKIMENKEASGTTMSFFHTMLTNKDVESSIDRQTYWLPEWIEYRNLEEERSKTVARMDELFKMGELTDEQEEEYARLQARVPEIINRQEELRPIMQEIRESKREQAEIDTKRTKAVFLSATPFNQRESVKYAEGYLFSYPEEDERTKGTYNHRSPHEAFLEQTFPAGYRWRYGRLENHVENADALSRQEIDFSDYLQNELGTMSGRMISSDYDYSRDFPVLTLDNAGRFNQAMSEVYRNKRYNALGEIMQKIWNYNDATCIFESMKTSLVNERIKEHLARGHKVVVFHRRRTGKEIAYPFTRAMDAAREIAALTPDPKEKQRLLEAVENFEHDFRDIFEWEKTIDYTLPREQIEKRFGKDKVAFFSGAETKGVKHKSVEEFMRDNGGKDIIVIQEASGKEGISLHDQTGNHQRVEINLALPQSPISFIQIEGRIYRIGQKSNAIFEYPLLGLDLETNLFAQKFNSALGTTENLALGSKARNLRKSIATSVLENTGEVEYDRQGYGGKDMDGRVSESVGKDGFDTAIQDYYGNQKIKRGREDREGVDYFPTPEPIGYKMVEFGQMVDGETALEPSAGHGAIARYVPETNAMTAIEPSASLFTKLQMRAGGPGRRFEEIPFEDYPLANKHDVILMNPPYGVGGKTAMEHVSKAFKHLNEGGRVVAIIPDGPAMEKRFTEWLASKDLNGAAVVTGEVKLPSAAFGRAGTNVRTRIVVIDKVSRKEMRDKVPQKVMVDLSNEESIGGLFDRIRNVRMPERTIDQVAINSRKALKTKRAFDDNLFTREFEIDNSGHLTIRNRSRYGGLNIYLDLKNPSENEVLRYYREAKEMMEEPTKADYGRWAGRSLGTGKNKVPATDAIKEYAEHIIKTLENVSGMTADQMDKRLYEKQQEKERLEAERKAAYEREQEERRRRQEETLNGIVNKALTENADNPNMSSEEIERRIRESHNSTSFINRIRSRNELREAGIDWETGEKINKNEPVNARTATVVEPQQQTEQSTIEERKARWQGGGERKPSYEYVLDKNTRTGADMHLVKMNDRLSDADYKAVERKAKAQNGYYSRFKKAWHFPTEEDAKKFLESVNASEGNSGEPQTRFRLREKDAPKKTKKVYKLMRLGDDGKLYPLFIDAAAPTELGKWYDADSPNVKDLEKLEPGYAYKIDKDGNVVDSKPVNRTKTTITGLPKVQMINDATNEESRWITVTTDKKGAKTYHNVGINGSGQPGTFAMRPGWHAGSLPSMRQIGKGRDRNLRDDKFVWVEGEVPADVDYQEEANSNPFKDIPTHIPEDGYYMKATNANKAASQADRIGWYVAGAFRPNRIMSDHEARRVIDDWNAEHPDQKVEYDFDRESGRQFNAETMELEEPVTTRFSRKTRSKKTTPETNVVPEDKSSFKATGFSSVDGAKVRNNLDTFAKESAKITLKKKNTFISDLAERIGAVKKGSNSKYAKFETKNGNEVLVRLSDHNATVSNFDYSGEKNGISIVVSRKPNKGIINDGDAHIAEFFYSDNELKNANGNPYSEIVKSLHQALYSGEYKDNTGIAKREEVNSTMEGQTMLRKGGELNPVEAEFERRRKEGEKVAKDLNMDVEYITDISQVTNQEVRDAIAAGEEPTGWTEIGKDGKAKVYMYLPNIRDRYEAEKTIAHEVIGHHGMRELLGEKGYKSYMRALVFDLKDKGLDKYIDEHLSEKGFDLYRTVDEYLAEAAEKGYGDLSMWQKVREKFTDAMRKAGFTMAPSIADVKYMVWLSKQNLRKGNLMDEMKRERLLFRLGQEKYEAKVRNGEFTYEDGGRDTSTNNTDFLMGGKTLFRHTPSVKNQKLNYERALHRLGYVWKESHVDSMQAGVELMRAMTGVKKIEDIPSAENFVLAENQMSSKEEQMDFLFNRDKMEPLDKAVAACLPDMGSDDVNEQLRNLQLYMVQKHGLERNRYIPVRDHIRALRKDDSVDQKQVDKLEQDYWDMIMDARQDLRDGAITLREYFEDIDQWIKDNIDKKYKAGDNDYSGLSSMSVGGKKGTYDDSDMIDDVMSVESKLGAERVNDLWEKTKAVSQFALDMDYEGGFQSKATHDKVSRLFEWYVPLRGYDETTAEEVYDYLEEKKSGNWVGSVLRNAKGHEHLSDVDVFAQLGAMSSNAIHNSLQNQMKQNFARFVRNHYNDVGASERLVTELPYLWAEKHIEGGKEVWVEKFPDIPEGAKADDIAAILEQYQQDMEAKAQTGDAKRIRQNTSIPYRTVKKENRAQHIVEVYINGEKHAFVVNGNPRAAQAINGQLKAERRSNILWLSSLSHFMSKMSTSYSPDFITRNTERDLIYSAANIAIKENAKYWTKWAKNYGVATGRVGAGVPAMHTNLFKRYRQGNLNMNNETDRYFKEFMENGGETGWVETKNLDKWKKVIKKGVKPKDTIDKALGFGKEALEAIPDVIEAMNERAENLARFATYMTSRQTGRSIARSVSDAKEVSVNFNRKGAGAKTAKFHKKDGWLSNANAFLAGWSAQSLQDYIMFYNAGVQGMNNMLKNVSNHPIKSSATLAMFLAAGMLIPRLNQFLYEEDDDKDEKTPSDPYAMLPEYIRRNNLCIYRDKGDFITISLPIELRAFYGIGDIVAGITKYPNLRNMNNPGLDIVSQLSQITPLDFMGEGAGPIWKLVPSGIRPIVEAAANVNWTGIPIEYEETEWNKDKPRWTRAFKNAGDLYVGLSKKLNAATNPYNDENIKGWADGAITDPALVEHVVNGYLGGFGSTANRLAQLVKKSDEMTFSEALGSNFMPIVRTQHYTADERAKNTRIKNRWHYYLDEANRTNITINRLKEDGKDDPMAYMRSISESEGKKASRAEIINKAEKQYNHIKKALKKSVDPNIEAELQRQLNAIMEETVNELDKIK